MPVRPPATGLRRAALHLTLHFHALLFLGTLGTAPMAWLGLPILVVTDVLASRPSRINGRPLAILQACVRLAYALMLLLGSLLVFPWSMADGPFLAGVLGLGGGIYLSGRLEHVRVRNGLVGIAWVVAAVYGLQTGHLVFLVVTVAGSAWLLWCGLPGRQRTHAFHLALSAMAVVAGAQAVWGINAFDGAPPAEILEQPGVTSVFQYRGDDPLAPALDLGSPVGPRRIRSISEGCSTDVLFLTAMHPDSLIEVHPGAKAFVDHLDLTPHDNVEVDCAKGELYAASFSSTPPGLTVLDLSGAWAQVLAAIPVSTRSAMRVLLDRARGRLLWSDEDDRLMVLDLGNRREITTYDGDGANRLACWAGRTVATRGINGAVSVLSWTQEGDRIVHRADIPLSAFDRLGQGNIACHPTLPLLYVNAYWTGRLLVYDLDRLEQVGDIPLAPGVRYINMTQDGSRLVSVGHRNGEVFVVDTATLSVLQTVRVGRGARWAAFSQDERFVYVASTLGGFRIRMP